MKFARLVLFFLISLVIIIASLSAILPGYQKVERSTTINASAASIYQYLSKLENFIQWSVWNKEDSTASYTMSGTDGTPGATYTWKGHPAISGNGSIKITDLKANNKVGHKIEFIHPQKTNADSEFLLTETNGTTLVQWNFKLTTPRPWNIFNLFTSLDKQMGKDFDDGLLALKTIMEKQPPAPVK
jgi:Tfp pilus assembly major pilin PilA